MASARNISVHHCLYFTPCLLLLHIHFTPVVPGAAAVMQAMGGLSAQQAVMDVTCALQLRCNLLLTPAPSYSLPPSAADDIPLAYVSLSHVSIVCLQLSCKRWVASARNKLWWMTPEFGTSARELPPEVQFLLVEVCAHIQGLGFRG